MSELVKNLVDEWNKIAKDPDVPEPLLEKLQPHVFGIIQMAKDTRPEQPEPGECIEISTLESFLAANGKINIDNIGKNYPEWNVNLDMFMEHVRGLKTHTIPEKLSARDVVRRIKERRRINTNLPYTSTGRDWLDDELKQIEAEIGGEG